MRVEIPGDVAPCDVIRRNFPGNPHAALRGNAPAHVIGLVALLRRKVAAGGRASGKERQHLFGEVRNGADEVGGLVAVLTLTLREIWMEKLK